MKERSWDEDSFAFITNSHNYLQWVRITERKELAFVKPLRVAGALGGYINIIASVKL